MRRTRFLLLGLAAVGIAAAADPPADEPAKSPWEALRDPQAKAAKARYDAAVDKARREYGARLTDARQTLVGELKDLEAAVTKSGDLDRALSVRAARVAADDLPPAAAPVPPPRPGALVFKGVQYRVLHGSVTWTEARARCKKLGGDLAVLDTPEKRAFFQAELGGLPDTCVGASKHGGRWTWVNGKPVTPESWYPAHPLNPSRTYAYLSGDRLKDGVDSEPLQRVYICEWPR